MDVEVVPIESIHADPANVRKHGERNLDAIKASLARFGQQKPVVVDGKGIVRAGNGTLEAARALGWESIAVVRTPLVGSEATAYAIADNRTSELAVWDETGLAETLRALQSEDFSLDAVGYSDAEVDAMIEGLATDALVQTEPVFDSFRDAIAAASEEPIERGYTFTYPPADADVLDSAIALIGKPALAAELLRCSKGIACQSAEAK